MKYVDLYSLPEDERINLIGQVASQGKRVAITLEKDDSDKIDRYIKKMTERFPTVELIDRFDGPVPQVISLVFALKKH